MKELIIYNANREKRERLMDWLVKYSSSKNYKTNSLDFSKKVFFLRLENESLVTMFKTHWLGELEFYHLDTYNGRAVEIRNKKEKVKFGEKLKPELLQEISDWFADNLDPGSYEESLVKNGRIYFIKKEEDINLLRLMWGHQIQVLVRDYNE